MSAARAALAIRTTRGALSPPRPFALAALPPTLVSRTDTPPDAAPTRRAKIWEFNSNLHCSIIGTCLSTGELRQILKKLGVAPPDSTDHELHGTAVTLAGRHDNAAKLLNKSLDTRHKLAIAQFARAATADRVRALWRDAVQRGEIPGAYWAALTHPATTPALIREAFGDVHMLSHLVGAANRADIRRLCQLEADKAELTARLERQQLALHEAVVTRDARIQDLRQTLAQRIAAETAAGSSCAVGDSAVLHQLVSDLERRLASETRRRVALEARLATAEATITQERSARLTVEHDNATLREELAAIETSLVQSGTVTTCDPWPESRLDDVALLYVGGRPNQIVHLRAAAERLGATFLHHDGGIENHTSTLPGLISRADLVLFPVDCISHDAAHTIKLLCRQAGKRFVPLRAASVTALLAALRGSEIAGCAVAAE